MQQKQLLLIFGERLTVREERGQKEVTGLLSGPCSILQISNFFFLPIEFQTLSNYGSVCLTIKLFESSQRKHIATKIF